MEKDVGIESREGSAVYLRFQLDCENANSIGPECSRRKAKEGVANVYRRSWLGGNTPKRGARGGGGGGGAYATRLSFPFTLALAFVGLGFSICTVPPPPPPPPPSPVPRLLPPPLPHLSSRYFRRLETNFPLKLLHLVGSPRRRYIGSLSYFGKFRCAGIVKPRFTMGLAKPAKRRLCVASTTGVLRTWDVYSQPKSIFQLTVSLVHFSSLLTY